MATPRKVFHVLPHDAVWVLAALALALGTGMLLAFPGRFGSERPQAGPALERPARAIAAAPAPAAETSAATPTTAAKPKPAARKPAPAAAKSAVFVITASRGDCWLQARAGSGTGRVLYEGVLPRGRSLTLEAGRIWLRLGAAANVDVVVDGRPRTLPPGTVDVLVDRGRAV